MFFSVSLLYLITQSLFESHLSIVDPSDLPVINVSGTFFTIMLLFLKETTGSVIDEF